MTEVWFYVSEDASGNARALLLKRLLERARQSARRLYVHTNDAAAAQRLDQWLWQAPGSFLPHGLHTEANVAAQSVVIGHGDDPGEHHDLLINLADQVPDFFSRFQRVVELVGGSENDRTVSRERWKLYRDRGYAVTKHELG